MSSGVYATEALTRVLIEHFGFPNRGGLLDCVCGALRDRTVREHSAHQAAAVIEALELREECRYEPLGMGIPTGRRLVTPWQPIGEETK